METVSQDLEVGLPVSMDPWGVLRALADCVAVVDARGVVRYRNEAWERLDREMDDGDHFRVGVNFFRAFESWFGEENTDGAAFLGGLLELLAGSRDRYEATCCLRWRGGRRWCSVILTPCDVGGERGALVQRIDVTEKRRADEESARLYREAREAVRVRDEFLSVAAHELKTPLTSLRGYVQLLGMGLDRDGTVDVPRLRQALKTIDQQSAKLARLSAQLLDISRIEAGRLVVEPKLIDVAALVKEVVTAAQDRTRRHAIELLAPPSLDAIVDPLRLEQVVTNLIDNAIKFSPDGGPIVVAVSKLEPGLASVVVTDRGIGVLPEHRARIFDRFFQAQSGHRLGGMGLGLYISRQIVELHGGALQAEFPDEGGTRFRVMVPIGYFQEDAAAEGVSA